MAISWNQAIAFQGKSIACFGDAQHDPGEIPVLSFGTLAARVNDFETPTI